MILMREQRKTSRQSYWKPLIAIEMAVIVSIAWMIQMEIIRLQLVPSYMTFTQMKKFSTFQQEVISQATGIFGKMYRNMEYGKFILTDTGNNHLDGRIGYIDWYDSTCIGYHVLLCPRGKSDPREGVHMVVKPEHMESVKKVDTHHIHRDYVVTKTEECHVSIQNFLPKRERDVFPVVIRSAVLQKLMSIYPNLDRQSNEAFLKLVELQEQVQQIEEEQKQQIADQQCEYEQAMSKLFSHYTHASTRPRKRTKLRKDSNAPLSHQEMQIQAVWKSKMDYVRSVIFERDTDDEEHLFTFPFTTTDNSLMSCSDHMIELGAHHRDGVRHDNLFKSISPTPVILTTASLKSLQPGFDIDEDVLNFCAKW